MKLVIIFQSIYINGSPQNTFVPGIVQFAEQNGVFIAGDDFKSGQTKLKSVLFDFLVGAGIKPASVVSYNHLGNNDGRNLSAPQQFRSKEVRVSSPGRPVGGDVDVRLSTCRSRRATSSMTWWRPTGSSTRARTTSLTIAS